MTRPGDSNIDQSAFRGDSLLDCIDLQARPTFQTMRAAKPKPPVSPNTDATVDRPEMIEVSCSLCGQATETRLVPKVIHVTCPNCGLSFVHESHLQPAFAAIRETIHTPEPEPEPVENNESKLRDWLDGAPLIAKEPTDWQRILDYAQRYFVLLTVVAIIFVGSLGTAAYCFTQYDDVTSQRSDLALELDQTQGDLEEAQRLADEKTLLAQNEKIRADQAEADRLATLARNHELEQERQRVEAGRLQVEQRQAELQRETRILQAEDDFERSRNLRDAQPQESLHLAYNAAQTMLDDNRPVPLEAQQTLYNALARAGGKRLAGHQQSVEAVAISKNGRWLLSGSSDATARLWDLQDPARESTLLSGHQGRITAVAITPNNHWAITASQDSRVILWDLTAPNPNESSISLGEHNGPITALAVSPDGHWLVTSSEGHEGNTPQEVAARLWDLPQIETSKQPIRLQGHTAPIRCIGISPDSHWVVIGSDDATVRKFDLWARVPSASLTVLRGHYDRVTSIAFGPIEQDGTCEWMVTGSQDNTARMWGLKDPEPSKTSIVLGGDHGHDGWIDSVAISPGGHWIATGSYDNTIGLWEMEQITRDPLHAKPIKLEGHQSRVHRVNFTPDGKWLVSGSYDCTVRLWPIEFSLPTMKPLVLPGHLGPINDIAISSDGRVLATCSGNSIDQSDTDVRLWDLDVNALLTSAECLLSRPAVQRIARPAGESLMRNY